MYAWQVTIHNLASSMRLYWGHNYTETFKLELQQNSCFFIWTMELNWSVPLLIESFDFISFKDIIHKTLELGDKNIIFFCLTQDYFNVIGKLKCFFLN